MTAFLPFILRHWKLLGIGVLLLAFGIMLAVKNGQIHSRERRIEAVTVERERARADLATCLGNASRLEAAVQAQNRAVEAQRAAGAARVAELEQTLAVSRRSAQTAQSRAAAVLARRPGADQCGDALAIMRGE